MATIVMFASGNTLDWLFDDRHHATLAVEFIPCTVRVLQRHTLARGSRVR